MEPAAEPEVAIPFRQTDPLPLLPILVNGREVIVLLDTGGSDLLLDPAIAAEVGAASFGSIEGTFGGGRKAPTGLGSVETLQLGPWIARNVPIVTVPTARFGAVCGGCRVDGVLGTGTLLHFLATIDYPAGALRLRRRGAADPDAARAEHRMPIWLAGDHYVLALGEARRADLVAVVGPFPAALETSQGIRIAGLVSHAFFRPWALSLDFERMELSLASPPTSP
jgi:hypothetical protein